MSIVFITSAFFVKFDTHIAPKSRREMKKGNVIKFRRTRYSVFFFLVLLWKDIWDIVQEKWTSKMTPYLFYDQASFFLFCFFNSVLFYLFKYVSHILRILWSLLLHSQPDDINLFIFGHERSWTLLKCVTIEWMGMCDTWNPCVMKNK